MYFKYLFIYYYCLNTVVSIFTPPWPPRPTHTYLPCSNPSPLLCPCPLYMFLDGLPPIFPHYLPLPSPLVTVSLLLNSMFLVVFLLL